MGVSCSAYILCVNRSFSILLRIDLVFGATEPTSNQHWRSPVSVSSCGSTWFLGLRRTRGATGPRLFQYPLADRLGFWGRTPTQRSSPRRCFSILLRIDLVFGGSSGLDRAPRQDVFQYPLADRLGFWGSRMMSIWSPNASFSILLRIDLVFGVSIGPLNKPNSCSFSILLRIDLVFGGSGTLATYVTQPVSVSSCGSTWFLGG